MNYWVKLISPKEKQNTVADKEDTSYNTRPIKYPYLIGKKFDTSYNTADPRAAYISSKPVKKKVVDADGKETGQGYLDNLDPFCYIYEPQEFVDSKNNAISEALHEWGYDNIDDLSEQAFFSLEGGKLVFYQSAVDEMRLVFSENLYKYFGIGFNTKRVPSENGFMIAIDKLQEPLT